MKKLLEQIIKFGFVGVLCFLIDFAISTGLFHLLNNITSRNIATAVGGFFGFTISVVVNYILSMKFVFERKEDLSRKKEFVIFLILSVIGLGINEAILLACSAGYEANAFLFEAFSDTVWFV
ncbi:MAG: GtrA family protein, partial [Lachnospiraceae bacterium]|nr:GtrA family protein [Lachnospiraceae bacterium]